MPGIVCFSIIGEVLCAHLPASNFAAENTSQLVAEIRRRVIAAQMVQRDFLTKFDCDIPILGVRAQALRIYDFYVVVATPDATIPFGVSRMLQTLSTGLGACKVASAADLRTSVSAFLLLEELCHSEDDTDPASAFSRVLTLVATRDHFEEAEDESKCMYVCSSKMASSKSAVVSREAPDFSLQDLQFAFPDDATSEGEECVFVPPKSRVPELPVAPPLAAQPAAPAPSQHDLMLEHSFSAPPVSLPPPTVLQQQQQQQQPAAVTRPALAPALPAQLVVTETVDTTHNDGAKSTVRARVDNAADNSKSSSFGTAPVEATVEYFDQVLRLAKDNGWAATIQRPLSSDEMPLKIQLSASAAGADLIVKLRWAWNPFVPRCDRCVIELDKFDATEVLTRPPEHCTVTGSHVRWTLVEHGQCVIDSSELLAAKLCNIRAGVVTQVTARVDWAMSESDLANRIRVAGSSGLSSSGAVQLSTRSGDYSFTCSVPL